MSSKEVGGISSYLSASYQKVSAFLLSSVDAGWLEDMFIGEYSPNKHNTRGLYWTTKHKHPKVTKPDATQLEPDENGEQKGQNFSMPSSKRYPLVFPYIAGWNITHFHYSKSPSSPGSMFDCYVSLPKGIGFKFKLETDLEESRKSNSVIQSGCGYRPSKRMAMIWAIHECPKI